LKKIAIQAVQEEFGIDLVYAKAIVDLILNAIEKKRQKFQQDTGREGSRNHRMGGLNMTVKEAMAEVRKLGMVLSKTEYGEFRVNFKGGSEESAYYTDDLSDAVGTARAMKKRKQPEENGQPVSHGLGCKSSRNGASRSSAARAVLPPSEEDNRVFQMGVNAVEDSMASNPDESIRFFVEFLGLSEEHAKEAFQKLLKRREERSRGAFRCAVNGRGMNGFSSSQTLDRVSDHLEALRQHMPREASNLRGLALRLDRVSNTLEAEEETTDRVSKIESELDNLGVDFTVAPNSSGKQATCIFAYKGQLNSRDEASVLGRIAKKHGSTLENGSRAYKITIPHPVRI
jgi:hypothetical protein